MTADVVEGNDLAVQSGKREPTSQKRYGDGIICEGVSRRHGMPEWFERGMVCQL